METFDSVLKRRSIRKFSNKEISKEIMEKILLSGISAPSPKNRQLWRFIVFGGEQKKQVIEIMRQGVIKESENPKYLPNSGRFVKGTLYTIDIMEQASVLVFAYNPIGESPLEVINTESRFFEMANLQCMGAAFENMSIVATEMNIGSLWICDIYFAYKELVEWLHIEGQLVACMAFGYPDENPDRRPRKSLEQVVTWRL